MTVIRSLSPTSFSKVPNGGVIRVFHELIKRCTIPQVQSKQNALSNLRVIVNTLCVLEDNGFKKNHPLSVPLPITNPIKFYREDSHNSSWFSRKGHHSVGLAYKQVFYIALDTYCLPLFLHPSSLLDFGAPNHGRRYVTCSQRQGGRRLGGLPFVLKGWSFQPKRMGVSEEQLSLPRHIPAVSAADMAGCWPTKWRHCLGNFLAGWSWHHQALEFRVRQCGRKAPLVVRVQRACPSQTHAFTPVNWCVQLGMACWTGSWLIFWLTQHQSIMTIDITKTSKRSICMIRIRLASSHELQGLVIWKSVFETCGGYMYLVFHSFCLN